LSKIDKAIDNCRRKYPKDKDVAELITCLQIARRIHIDKNDDEELIKQLGNAAIYADSSLIEAAYLRIRRLTGL
jgi:hypothetical protein